MAQKTQSVLSFERQREHVICKRNQSQMGGCEIAQMKTTVQPVNIRLITVTSIKEPRSSKQKSAFRLYFQGVIALKLILNKQRSRTLLEQSPIVTL